MAPDTPTPSNSLADHKPHSPRASRCLWCGPPFCHCSLHQPVFFLRELLFSALQYPPTAPPRGLLLYHSVARTKLPLPRLVTNPPTPQSHHIIFNNNNYYSHHPFMFNIFFPLGCICPTFPFSLRPSSPNPVKQTLQLLSAILACLPPNLPSTLFTFCPSRPIHPAHLLSTFHSSILLLHPRFCSPPPLISILHPFRCCLLEASVSPTSCVCLGNNRKTSVDSTSTTTSFQQSSPFLSTPAAERNLLFGLACAFPRG